MGKSLNELTGDPNFMLKFVVLIVGILVNLLLIHPTVSRTSYAIVINGYHFSYLTVIGTLVIACIFFEPTPVTETCLLVAALAKLLMITNYADRYNIRWDGGGSNLVIDEDGMYVEHNDNKYYAFMIANIGSMVLISIDIILRTGKN